MFSCVKLIVSTSVLVCSFGFAAKAQLASDKSINEIYNKKINEKLAQKNKSDQFVASTKEQNLPSERSSLKEVAKLKIKNPKIIANNNTTQSDEEKKKKLPSNSTKLKQIGATAGKSPVLHSK
jgi:hypothetical protein